METTGQPTEPTQADLEQAAAEFMGEPPQEPVAATSEPPAPATKEPDEGAPSEPSDPFSELREALKDTPYYQEGGDIKESVAKLKNGYKELQGEYTRTKERVKPFEQLVQKLSTNHQLRQTLEQVLPYLENPAMLQAYTHVGPNGQLLSRPDPLAYGDLYDPQVRAKYDQDVAAYEQRMLDERLNTRLSSYEQQQKLELQKLEFKKAFPEIDPEVVLSRAQSELAGQNPLVLAHKALNYDNLYSQALEKARKELSQKLEEAGKNKTPAASAPTQPVNVGDILKAIETLGSERAVEKYGQKRVNEALRETANFI